jgi:hypothetical protein
MKSEHVRHGHVWVQRCDQIGRADVTQPFKFSSAKASRSPADRSEGGAVTGRAFLAGNFGGGLD